MDDLDAEWYDVWAGATLSGVTGWDGWVDLGWPELPMPL
jgi:hypothetical protein